MRRLTLAALGLALLAAPGCRRQRPLAVVTEESMGPLLAEVEMSNPHGAVQLLKGFHELENGSWRWSASRFQVALRPAAPAAQYDLRLTGALPEAVFARTGPVTVSAAIDGQPAGEARIAAAGPVDLHFAIPADRVPATGLTAGFTLDHFLPPAPAERRELGLIVALVGLSAR